MKPKIPFDNVDFDEEKFIEEHEKQFGGWDIYWDIIFCCEKGKLTLLKWLLDDCDGYYYDDPRKHGFLNACECGHLNVVKWLAIDNDYNVEPLKNLEGLRDAFINGHVNVVEWFLSLPYYYYCIDPNEDDDDKISYLLEKRNNKMNRILKVLYYAIDKCNENTITWLDNYLTQTNVNQLPQLD